LVKQLITGGYQVKVLTRSSANAAHLPDEVTLIEGNLFNSASLVELLNGCDAVVSCAGPPIKGKYNPEDYIQGMKLLIEGMENLQVKRLITIAGASIVLPGERLKGKRKFLRVVFRLLFGKTVRTKDGETALIANSNLRWTIVRPGFVKSAPDGKFNADEEKLGATSVDKIQLINFLVDGLNIVEWEGRAPLVATI